METCLHFVWSSILFRREDSFVLCIIVFGLFCGLDYLSKVKVGSIQRSSEDFILDASINVNPKLFMLPMSTGSSLIYLPICTIIYFILTYIDTTSFLTLSLSYLAPLFTFHLSLCIPAYIFITLSLHLPHLLSSFCIPFPPTSSSFKLFLLNYPPF